jgi:hypothetical protein
LGLVIHWKMDEGTGDTLTDASGTGNAGHLAYGLGYVQGGFPRARFPNPYALSFDGSDDKIQLKAHTRLPALNVPKTVAFWLHPKRHGPNQSVCSFGSSAGELGFSILQSSMLVARHAGVQLPTSVPAFDQWHHVALIFDGQRTSVFVDGAMVASKDGGAGGSGAITGVNVGGGGNNNARMLLDDFRLYARALTEAEVRGLADGQP